mgnify:CR=1 FL=1
MLVLLGKRRYAVFILVLLALVFVFGGCGKKRDVAEDSSYSGEVYSENGLPKDKKVKISGMFPVQGWGKEYMEYAIETFEKKFPNVDIEMRYIEAGQVAYKEIINSAVQGGNEKDIPDWVYNFGSYQRQLIEQGKLEPQEELLERQLLDKSEVKVKDVIKLDEREIFSPDGHMYKMPESLMILGLYYNQKMMRDFGLEKEPQHWEEYLDYCAKIKAQGVSPLVMDGKHATEYFEFGWGTIPFAVGGEKYRDDLYYNRPDVYISKPFVTMYERLVEFSKRGYLHPGTASFDHTQSQMEFLQGEAAMTTNGTWIANEMRDVLLVDFEWGFMPFPGNDKGQKQVLILYASGSGFIWKNKPELTKQWAKEFNLWLLNIDIQEKMAKTGIIPVRSDFINESGGGDMLSPSAKVAMGVIQNPKIELVNHRLRERTISNVEMSKIGKMKGDNYIALISGQKSPTQAAKDLNALYMKGLALEEK